jgi:putative membrane protein
MRIIKQVILLSIAVFAASYFIQGVHINPIWTALIVGAVLTVINFVVKPIIRILTLPINILTLGLFSVAVNVAIFWFIGTGNFIKGFVIDNWQAALYGSIIISVVSWIGERVLGSNDD